MKWLNGFGLAISNILVSSLGVKKDIEFKSSYG
jgi:hypothetical protein